MIALPLNRLALYAFFLLVVFAAIGTASASAINASTFGKVAIEGTDPVAYFTQGKPVEGKKDFSTKWNGATWRFATADNLAKFESNPSQYAPQYGGYCAWAVSQGYTASIDPEAWRIVDGKLYLNYSKNVQQTWQQDIPGNIAKANGNWPKIEADLKK